MIEEIQKQILDRMRPGYRYARADLVTEDNPDLSPSLWKQAMALLVEQGKITRTGQKRGTRYHISGYPLLDDDEAPPPPTPNPAPEPRPAPTPGIVMRRPASSDLLSDTELGLRRRPTPPPMDTPFSTPARRFQEPAPIHGTGLRPPAYNQPPPSSAPRSPPRLGRLLRPRRRPRPCHRGACS